ncbi:hypothetical protein D5086_016356 [Populus alba]|uniref:Uncharacterized protein n=1 Tax=Populus alba TaxID=43335 RepID=A0ACC4BV85_POPAL
MNIGKRHAASSKTETEDEGINGTGIAAAHWRCGRSKLFWPGNSSAPDYVLDNSKRCFLSLAWAENTETEAPGRNRFCETERATGPQQVLMVQTCLEETKKLELLASGWRSGGDRSSGAQPFFQALATTKQC